MRFFVRLLFVGLLALAPVHVGTSLIAGVPIVASIADMVGVSEAKAQGIYQGGSYEPGLVPWRGRTSLGPWGVQRPAMAPQQRPGPVFYHRSPPQQHWGGFGGGFRPPMQQGFQGGYGGQQQGGFGQQRFHVRQEWYRHVEGRAPAQGVRIVIGQESPRVRPSYRPRHHVGRYVHHRRYYRRYQARRAAPRCLTCCCAPAAQPAIQQCTAAQPQGAPEQVRTLGTTVTLGTIHVPDAREAMPPVAATEHEARRENDAELAPKPVTSPPGPATGSSVTFGSITVPDDGGSPTITWNK